MAQVTPAPHIVHVTLRINGAEHHLAIDPRVTLLDVLREYAGPTGTKKGCDQGQRGPGTVHVSDRRVLACPTLEWERGR
jgi:xanthine dehydrogenase YagT iron-sulfur-binding subunit